MIRRIWLLAAHLSHIQWGWEKDGPSDEVFYYGMNSCGSKSLQM